MVERFGYSLDVGKSLESEKDSEEKEGSKKEKAEEEVLETPKGEELSADSVQKDILDDIKEDIEVRPINAEEVDSPDELPEDFAEEGVSADRMPPIIDDESAQDEDVIDKKEELDEFEEPMPDEPEDEPEPGPEKPPGPEEEDVNEMVDESFKEQNKVKESSDDKKGFGLWKWSAGIALVLILAVIVYKLGFVGVVDANTPVDIPSDEDIDAELEDFFRNSEVISDVPAEEPVMEDEIIVPVENTEKEESPKVIKTKDPEELLDLLNQGLN